MTSHTLVFGDDTSAGADAAWLWVCEHRWPGWRAEIVQAFTPPLGPPPGELAATPQPWEPDAARHAFGEVGFDEVVHLRAEADPRVVLARCREAGLVVVGPTGAGRAARIGSTTEYLMYHPPAPLLIAKRARPTRRVLVGVDGSADARHAVEALASMPWLDDVEEITLVGVQDRAADFDAVLKDAQAGLPGAAVLARTVPCVDSVWKTLVAEGDAARADLYVLGTRGMRPLRRIFLGSTAARVVHHVDVPVLLATASGD
jgi:nucleotide-binding universal stress UspA family protein